MGACIVGSMAGELIAQFTMAIQNDVGAEAMAKLIMPYPTHAEAIKYCCHQFNIFKWGGWAGLKQYWEPQMCAKLKDEIFPSNVNVQYSADTKPNDYNRCETSYSCNLLLFGLAGASLCGLLVGRYKMR